MSSTACSIELRTAERRPYGVEAPRSRAARMLRNRLCGNASGSRAAGRSAGVRNCGSGAPRSIRSALRRLSLRSLGEFREQVRRCVSRVTPRLSMPVATTETRQYLPGFLESRADDDVGVLIDLLANAGRGFVDLEQHEVLAAGDGDDETAGALDRGVLDQWMGNRGHGLNKNALRPEAGPCPSWPASATSSSRKV